MQPLAPDILNTFALWPDIVQQGAMHVRTVCWDVAKAAETGPLDESLKWGQPAWRPRKPRIGSTLRLGWRGDAPDHLDLYVDCKTDIAARVTDAFPDVFDSDKRRRLTIALDRDLPTDALWHLVHQTLTYHRSKRGAAPA